jgi:hypothetical protein
MPTASDPEEELYWIILRNSSGSVWRSIHEHFGYSGKYSSFPVDIQVRTLKTGDRIHQTKRFLKAKTSH